jgi:hypothetical protein
LPAGFVEGRTFTLIDRSTSSVLAQSGFWRCRALLAARRAEPPLNIRHRLFADLADGLQPATEDLNTGVAVMKSAQDGA